MRVRRLLLIVGLLVAGGVAARPEEVIPFASRLVAPMLGHSIVKPVEPELPSFVPGSQNLKFKTLDDAAVAAVAVPAADEANPPAATLSTAQDVALAPAGENSSRSVDIVVTPDPSLTGTHQSEEAPTDGSLVAAVPPVQLQDPSAPNAPAPDGTTSQPAPPIPGQPAPVAAKTLFGAIKTPSPLAARAIGSYARGCLSGGAALPVDGPAWQAMRLSRNRNWGHPKLVALVQKLATDAKEKDSWPGLLVGDMSQPRGGPMLTGHASHQVGLDADVWLTPMPDHKLSNKEREEISATSMLDKTDLAVDPKVFTADHVKLIKRAASYPEVERVLVHPAIKKALCKAAEGDRYWLTKVRPYQGHYYHMHIRIGCPPGSFGCVPQKPPPGDDGCGKEVDEWLARLAAPPRPAVPGAKPSPPSPPITIGHLPQECRVVLQSGPDGIAAPAEVARPATSKAALSYPGHRVVLKPRAVRHAHK